VPPANVQRVDLGERARLSAALAPLIEAALQKAWLPQALLAVLQLRAPGRTVQLLVDARRGIALEVVERPEPPEQALAAQASLRNALAGARFEGARLERMVDHPAKAPHLRLSFATPRGPRALVAEPGAHAMLLLLAPDAQSGGERIVWLSADRALGPPPPERRTGASWPRCEPLATAEEAAPPAQPVSADALLAGDEARALAARRAALLKGLKARTGKLARTLAAVESDLARAERAGEDRRRAELLLPHQGRVPRGAREASVPDWSRLDQAGQPAQEVLQLDPALSAAENAARWLKRAQRYRAALPRIEARRADVQRALEALRALQEQAGAAQERAALRAVEEEARGRGALAERLAASAPARKKGEERVPFRTFRSQSGARILVGRSAADNDALTLRWARGNDLWLHARGVQGAHVVVPEPGDSPDSRALIDAALLAAHFSSSRGADAVEVAWTRRKHVRKPKGAAPGSVTVTQEKVIRVRLDEARLAALLASEAER
jgi:predicted ribosome quality control (RQC) complex YloA/Tae2 family protein